MHSCADTRLIHRILACTEARTLKLSAPAECDGLGHIPATPSRYSVGDSWSISSLTILRKHLVSSPFVLSLVIEGSLLINTPPTRDQQTACSSPYPPAYPSALNEQTPLILFVSNLALCVRTIIDLAFHLNCNSKFTLFQEPCVERCPYQRGKSTISGSRS